MSQPATHGPEVKNPDIKQPTKRRLGAKDLLVRFFANYLWAGITLILAAIIADQLLKPTGFLVGSLLELVKTIGISVSIAAIFTFAAGSKDFMNQISNVLKDIVIHREFLNNLDEGAKKTLLYSLLRPSDQQKMIYSNIEDYYQHCIARTLKITSVCVRSNYHGKCRVYHDASQGKLIAEYTNTYRLFPSANGYDDIVVGFYGEEPLQVQYELVIIFPPVGKPIRYGEEELHALPREKSRSGEQFIRIPLRNVAPDAPHLDIELRARQIGRDHWVVAGFQARQPTDGFRFEIECERPCVIREEDTFLYGTEWHKEPAEAGGTSRFTIACQQWIDQGSGLAVLVGLPLESLGKDTVAEVAADQREDSLP